MMTREEDYHLSLEKLYETNQLLTAALLEMQGEEMKSASLFCLKYGIHLEERDKIILLLNKFSDTHDKQDIEFWTTLLCREIPFLQKLSKRSFQNMLDVFWKNYKL